MNLRLTLVVAVAALHAGRMEAQLASTSPFLPAQNAAPANAPTANAPLEYRGAMETADGVLYRVVDPAKKSGAWVKLNERESVLDFVVRRHEGSGDNDTIVVEQGGRTFTLPLRSAKVVSSGAAGNLAPPPAPMPAIANVPPAVTNAVVVNPTPADEQRRLEAVAAEVARRRALREQATQQINQGVPVAPPPMPVAQPVQPSQRTPPTTPQGRGQPPTRQR